MVQISSRTSFLFILFMLFFVFYFYIVFLIHLNMRGGMENRVKCSFQHVDQSHPDPNDPNHNPDPIPNHEPLPNPCLTHNQRSEFSNQYFTHRHQKINILSSTFYFFFGFGFYFLFFLSA